MKYNVRSYSCDAGSITIRSGGSRFLYPNGWGDGTHTVLISDVEDISMNKSVKRPTGKAGCLQSSDLFVSNIKRNHKQFYSFDVDEGEAELLDYDCDQTYAKVLCTFGEGRYFIYVLSGSVIIEKE